MAPNNTFNTPEGQNAYSRSSFTPSSPLAATAITRDQEGYADDEESALTTDDDDGEGLTLRYTNSHASENPHSLAGSYHRPSFFTTVSHATVVPHHVEPPMTQRERERMIDEERDLLNDNNVISEDERQRTSGRLHPRRSQGHIPDVTIRRDERPSQEHDIMPTEVTFLLGPDGSVDERDTLDDEAIDRKWEEAVVAGRIQTTWKRESMVLGRYAAPLMVTFLLQYSLTVASIFTLGHLGTKELGAVSLASMTASITGYAVYQGLATSLDTLCSQAFGSGRKSLVGLQMQKMVFFLWAISIPIAVVWFFADKILMAIVPDRDVAVLAGLYLKVLILGAPGYALFESGKRFVQAQGLFSASL